MAGLFISMNLLAQDSVTALNLPDSVKAISFYAEIKLETEPVKKGYTGIQTDVVKLGFERDKKERSFEFEFPGTAKVVAKGMDVEQEEDELEWEYNWSVGETYKLLVSVATDSAGNFSLYSGYVGLAKENNWKLIGTCRIEGRWSTIKDPAYFNSTGKNGSFSSSADYWVQRNNGTWRSLGKELPSPIVNVARHLDSASREKAEIAMIEAAIREGKTDVRANNGGVFYTILKEGAGRQVSLEDTVVVHYKGSLFTSGEIFDQTKDSPAKFPLNRLIRGWQLGVPMARVGSRIKLVIPSHLAYSIRTRAAKIPPNSILVFEIEIIDAIGMKWSFIGIRNIRDQ